MASRSTKPRTGGPVSLTDLGLTDAELQRFVVSDAVAAIKALEAVGRQPSDNTRRVAEGDPDSVAAAIADYANNGASNVA